MKKKYFIPARVQKGARRNEIEYIFQNALNKRVE